MREKIFILPRDTAVKEIEEEEGMRTPPKLYLLP
jgi:hypothetical protein